MLGLLRRTSVVRQAQVKLLPTPTTYRHQKFALFSSDGTKDNNKEQTKEKNVENHKAEANTAIQIQKKNAQQKPKDGNNNLTEGKSQRRVNTNPTAESIKTPENQAVEQKAHSLKVAEESANKSKAGPFTPAMFDAGGMSLKTLKKTHSILLTNLPQTAMKSDIQKFLNLPEPVPKERLWPVYDSFHMLKRVYACLPDGESQICALKLSGKKMGCRVINVSAVDAETVEDDVKKSVLPSICNETVVLISGLPYQCRQEDLMNLFMHLNLRKPYVLMCGDNLKTFGAINYALAFFDNAVDAHAAVRDMSHSPLLERQTSVRVLI